MEISWSVTLHTRKTKRVSLYEKKNMKQLIIKVKLL